MKIWYTSKELWFGLLVLVNLGLNSMGYMSFEPSPEFIAAVVVVFAALRTFFTKTAVTFSAAKAE